MAPTTDPAPVSTPPATPCQMMQAEVSKYTDWDAHIIQAIARAENGTCDPTRHNETASETHRDANGDVVCVGSYGALQVGCIHYLPTEDRSDLATNIRVAHRAWTSREAWGVGYEAWTMYLNGRYKENL